MIALVLVYYVFVYNPYASLEEDDDDSSVELPEEMYCKVNPVDSGFLLSIPVSSGRWYKAKLPRAERKRLEDTFNKVRTCCHCFWLSVTNEYLTNYRVVCPGPVRCTIIYWHWNSHQWIYNPWYRNLYLSLANYGVPRLVG